MADVLDEHASLGEQLLLRVVMLSTATVIVLSACSALR
jgi:hypothetical protein